MRKNLNFILCIAVLSSACGIKSRIQDTPEIHMSRDFGYSSLGGGEIQGNFSIAYSGPANIERVVFLIDGEPMGEVDSEFPYILKFATGS